MTIFAAQYLESLYPALTPSIVRHHLRSALERLPISLVLLGWELPLALEEAVAEETQRHHADLFRWLPLLTGDSRTDLPPEWATFGLGGNPVAGQGGKPEFTFICPNHSAVADFLSERVENIAASGCFQGIFLDRIRFPSPSIDPLSDLACFCKQCDRLAADTGLELESVRRYIKGLPPEDIVVSLLGKPAETCSPLESFLDFRSASITRTVRMVARQAQSLNLQIGLDCFSPSLTRMVGQDLSSLDGSADWVKIMTYPRVFGPAGIPFEFLGLLEWLTRFGRRDTDALHLISEASGLKVPANISVMYHNGLNSQIITQEIKRGYEQGVTTLLAGIPMVELENIHEATTEQIEADLEASRKADGLVISWDLWLTPLKYLDKIRIRWS